MDYLDNVTRDEEVLREARKEELRKLNEVYGAFKPRDRRELSKELTVFGQKMGGQSHRRNSEISIDMPRFQKKEPK